jgi:hypothetical protein
VKEKKLINFYQGIVAGAATATVNMAKQTNVICRVREI